MLKNLWWPQWYSDFFRTVNCDHHKSSSGKFLFFKTGLTTGLKTNQTNWDKMFSDRKHHSHIHVFVTLRTIFELTQTKICHFRYRQLTKRLLRWKNEFNPDYKNNNGRNFQFTKFSFIDFVLADRRSLSVKRPKSASGKSSCCRFSFSAVRHQSHWIRNFRFFF